MQINFVEVEPDPGEGRDGGDGAARRESTACRWCRRRPASKREDSARSLEGARTCSKRRRACMSARNSEIAATRSPPAPSADRDAARAAFARLREALSAGQVARRRARCRRAPSAGASTRWVEAGHSARLQVRRHGRRVDGPRHAAVLRQGHAAAEEARPRRRRPHRARRIGDSRRRVPRAGRHLHAADVREHRRLRRRGLDDRLARAGRLVRAGRRARARQRRRRRSAASSSRSARCR